MKDVFELNLHKKGDLVQMAQSDPGTENTTLEGQQHCIALSIFYVNVIDENRKHTDTTYAPFSHDCVSGSLKRRNAHHLISSPGGPFSP